MKMNWLAVGVCLVLGSSAWAEIKTKTVEYKDGELTCKGVLTYDDAKSGPRPGVLVIPEWWGLTDYPKKRAVQLAELGYVAFAADMYGDAKTTDDPKEAGKLAMALKPDAPKFRARTMAGLNALKSSAKESNLLDESKIAAIGYCFGGSAVLELARGGAPVAGVVSFHGSLASPVPAKAGDIKAKVLVCHGNEDPMVKPEEVNQFAIEMHKANVDYQINSYGGAMHAFTNPAADSHKIEGIKYDEKADKRSWEAMKAFLAEVFK